MKTLKTTDESRLATQYRLNMYIASAVVFVIASLVSAYQYYTQREQEINHIREIFSERALEISTLLKGTTDRVVELHKLSERYFKKKKNLPRSPLMAFLGDRPAEKIPNFSMEHEDIGINLHETGNLIGLGSFQGRESAFYEEVNALLWLLDFAKTAKETTPHISWIYFLSVNRIFMAFPASLQAEFDKTTPGGYEETIQAYQVTPWWDPILPENNPKGTPYWSKAYLDPGGGGTDGNICNSTPQGH